MTKPLMWRQSEAAGQEVDTLLQLILNIHNRRIAQKCPGFVQKAKLCQTLIKKKSIQFLQSDLHIGNSDVP